MSRDPVERRLERLVLGRIVVAAEDPGGETRPRGQQCILEGRRLENFPRDERTEPWCGRQFQEMSGEKHDEGWDTWRRYFSEPITGFGKGC